MLRGVFGKVVDESRELAILFFAAVRIAIVALAAWLVVLGSTLGLARALPSPGDILFSATNAVGETSNIFRVDVRTGIEVAMTDNPANEFTPIWSPDGQSIVFVADWDEDNELYLMDADGRNLHRLTENIKTVNNPVWSPDGQFIAFEAFHAGRQDIFVIDLATGTVRGLTQGIGNYAESPRWSPDSTRLVFVGDDRRDPELYIAGITVQGVERLTRNTFHDWSPAWSPDGRWLTYFTNADANTDVYALEITSREIVRLTYHLSSDWMPIWSPDGRYILFVSERSGTTALYVMDMICLKTNDCSDRVYALDSDTIAGSGDASWSPDGTRVSFLAWQDNKIYLADVTCITSPTGCSIYNSHPLTHREGGFEFAPVWRP